MLPKHPIFIGTFHKTGTILFTDIFRQIAEGLDLRLWIPEGEFWRSPMRVIESFDVLFDGGARFLWKPKLFTRDNRAVVSIRDPRDIVVSSALYHKTSKEAWVTSPTARFDGMSYQQVLNALPDDDARMIFEMDNSVARTLKRMLRIDVRDPRVCITRLDRLIVDTDLEEYRRIFAFLGFEDTALDICLAIARQNSVFAKSLEPGGHVRHTEPAIWKKRFTPALSAAFEERFPGVAEQLGYEPTFA